MRPAPAATSTRANIAQVRSVGLERTQPATGTLSAVLPRAPPNCSRRATDDRQCVRSDAATPAPGAHCRRSEGRVGSALLPRTAHCLSRRPAALPLLPSPPLPCAPSAGTGTGDGSEALRNHDRRELVTGTGLNPRTGPPRPVCPTQPPHPHRAGGTRTRPATRVDRRTAPHPTRVGTARRNTLLSRKDRDRRDHRRWVPSCVPTN
jgi:hypothetical protein